MKKLIETVDQSNSDELIYDTTHPLSTKGVELKLNQGVLLRGTVLGIVTATGKAVPVDKDAVDGSNKADCVLANDVDTNSTGTLVEVAYSSGSFNRKAMFVGAGDVVEDHELRLREVGIYLKDKL